MLCLLLSATFVDSGSVLTNGVVNNNICWFCTVEQNVDSRMDPNQQIGVVNNNICWFCTVEQNVDSRMDPNRQIVSPKTRETTNYTVGYLLTHQQVCWSTRWVQQPDCSFCAHFNKWCCPESTKCGAPTVSYNGHLFKWPKLVPWLGLVYKENIWLSKTRWQISDLQMSLWGPRLWSH